MPVGDCSAAHHGNRRWREVLRMTHPAGWPWSSDGRPLMPREPPDERGEQWEAPPRDHECPHHHEDSTAEQLDGMAVMADHLKAGPPRVYASARRMNGMPRP